MIRDLKGVLEREKAPIGIFLTLNRATKPMEAEAAAAGFYENDFGRYPRLQIFTVEDALRGARPRIPVIDTGAAFRRAQQTPRPIAPVPVRARPPKDSSANYRIGCGRRQ